MNGDELEREVGAGETKVRMIDLPMVPEAMTGMRPPKKGLQKREDEG